MNEKYRTYRITERLCMIYIVVFFILAFGTRVYGADRKITEFSSIFYIPAGAVEQGAGEREAARVLGNLSVSGFVEGEDPVSLNIKWDFSEVDFLRKGVYEVQGIPQIPEGWEVAENVTAPVYRTCISVQEPGKPEINACTCMKSAGLFVFPWVSGLDTDAMSVWLRKENGSWIDVTETGYALCEDEGLYLANSAMQVGNIYELTVKYQKGSTRILKFLCKSRTELEIISYIPGSVGGQHSFSRVLSSVEDTGNYLTRCSACAVRTGSDITPVLEELSRNVELMASTSEVYENTAENPAQSLYAVWDGSEVDTSVPGVYKVKGSFQVPDGYELAENLTLPEAYAYITVQKTGQPQVDTYYMPTAAEFFFPMVLDGFDDQEIHRFRVYLKEKDGKTVRLTDNVSEISKEGLAVLRSCFQEGKDYYLYINWDNGGTGVFSFTYDQQFITNENWLERNYADRDGITFPDISQEQEITPSPLAEPSVSESPSEEDRPEVTKVPENTSGEKERDRQSPTGESDIPSSSDALEMVKETVTDKWTVISGKRLQVILENSGESISFEKGGVSVDVPASVAEGWGVQEGGSVQVLIQKNGDESVCVNVYQGDQEITDIPGGHIKIPVDSFFGNVDPQSVTVTDEDGNEKVVSLDKEQNVLDIQTDKTGSFHIESKKKDTGKKGITAAAILVVAVLAAGFGRKTRKRGV